MQTESRHDRPHLGIPEWINPLFLLPYQMRRDLVLPENDPFEKFPVLSTNFRINRGTLDRLRSHLGSDVNELEHVIVDERCRILGSAVKWASQMGLTAFFVTGNLSVESLIGLYSAQAIGISKESEDRRRTYIRVYQTALPVIEKFYEYFQPDMWDKTAEQKIIFVPEVTEAVARGESLEKPQATALGYAALNSIALLISNQPKYILPLVVGEALVVAKQAAELGVGMDVTRRLQRFRASLVETAKADAKIGTDLLKSLFDFVGESDLVNRWMQGENYRMVLRIATQAGIPIAVLTKSITGLFTNTLREMANQLLAVDNQRGSYASAQVGIQKLKDALDIVESKKTSLLTPESILAHCIEFSERNRTEADEVVKRLSILNTDAIAVFAPFDLKYEDEKEQVLQMSEPAVIFPGLYFGSAPAGGAESPFLHGLLHRNRTDEHAESYIKADSEKPNLYFRLHNLAASQIQNFSQYIHPPEKNNLSPLSLFVQDIRDLVPKQVDGDPEVSDLLSRYHSGNLSPKERMAVTTCLQVVAGIATAKEAQEALIAKDVKEIVTKLLPFFTQEYGRGLVIDQLWQYQATIDVIPSHLINEEDIQAIEKASFQSALPKTTRAKLRIIHALEKAKMLGSKIIAIDQTLDPLSDDDSKIFMTFLSNWCQENGVAIIITTNDENNKKLIKDTNAYQGKIYFGKIDDNGIRRVGVENRKKKK